MKKVFALFTMLFASIVFASASDIPMFDCHAYACGVVEAYENSGSNPSLADLELAYHAAYTNCIN